MNSQLEQQIQPKDSYTNCLFCINMRRILEVGLNLEKEARVLLKGWDIDFVQELHRHGITEKTIKILINHNIRRSVLIHLTDADFNEIGVNTIGDRIILRNIINDLH
jgi:hypothetical protein